MSELGQQLIAIVRRKAKESPGFVYQAPSAFQCQYVDGAQPSCLIGHALWEAGLINAELELDHDGNTDAFRKLAIRLELPLEQDELTWLRTAQRAQDTKSPWGAAVLHADRQSISLEPTYELVS